MILSDSRKNEVEIRECHWPLAEDLFLKWGHKIESNATIVYVIDVDDITPELSAWGIPWKKTKWA